MCKMLLLLSNNIFVLKVFFNDNIKVIQKKYVFLCHYYLISNYE